MIPKEIVDWAFGEIAGSALHAALHSLLNKRLGVAREVLLEEISQGMALDPLPADEAAAATLRYLRAAQEGTGRRNLRLMAQVMRNLKPQTPSLYADEFLRWSDVLASLRREECIAVATLYRHEERLAAAKHDPNALAGGAMLATQAELIENRICGSDAEVIQTLSSTMRSGLVVSQTAWNGTVYSTTPLTKQLINLVSLESLGASED